MLREPHRTLLSPVVPGLLMVLESSPDGLGSDRLEVWLEALARCDQAFSKDLVFPVLSSQTEIHLD